MGKLLFFITLCIAIVPGMAADIVLSGIYQGKNLYVQNPFTGNMQDFCALDVWVNNAKVAINLKSSAFEIDLSYLQVNEEVTIRIAHKDDCKPKILNANVIKANSSFQFNSVSVDNKSISWSAKGEKPNGKYYVEHFLHNSWSAIQEVTGKGAVALTPYTLEEHHHSGINKYRIKYKDREGQVFYSRVVEFASIKEPISFYPKRATDLLHLTQSANYEIFDEDGNSLKKGFGDNITIADFKSGVYYLNIDNRTEKFLKK